MLSFWEKESFTNYDVAIIGGGITGLSTAISVKEKKPELKVIVLEKGLLPSGASTKNAGFACVGSLTEILDDLKHMPLEKVLKLVEMRLEGLNILRGRLGDKALDYQNKGSYELCFDDADYTDEIKRVNDLLLPIFNRPIFSISSKHFDFGKSVKMVIESSAEGQIDTGKMMMALLQKAMSLGIEVKTGYHAAAIQQTKTGVKIQNSDLPITAKKVGVCTNAFTKLLLPDLEIQPGRGQVLITKPIDNIPFEGIFHFMEGYYYFRTINNRVLFGGGRQLDLKGETTDSVALNTKIQEDLAHKLKTIILPNISFEIDYSWAGIMAFGNDKFPIIKSISDKVSVAASFGGMGVAIGGSAGESLANILLNND